MPGKPDGVGGGWDASGWGWMAKERPGSTRAPGGDYTLTLRTLVSKDRHVPVASLEVAPLTR